MADLRLVIGADGPGTAQGYLDGGVARGTEGYHTTRRLCDDLTIAICWDSDRLDLPRIGATVDPYYLNTESASQIALHESGEKH